MVQHIASLIIRFILQLVMTQNCETVVTIPELLAATQHVYVSESTKSEDGTQAIVKVSYNADDATTTGLGLRIHYDSSVFTLSDVADVLPDLFIPLTTSPTADTDDFDNDASTDSYILASWTSLFGQSAKWCANRFNDADL